MKNLVLTLLIGLSPAFLLQPAPAQEAATDNTEPQTATSTSEAAQPTEPTAPISGRRVKERHFDQLNVGELSFTNVWVHRQTNFNILIRHAAGIHTIRLTDLPKEDLDALRPQLGDLANIKEEKPPELVLKLRELQESEPFQQEISNTMDQVVPVIMAMLLPALAILIVLHLVSSFFIWAICRKTETKTGLEVWIPIVNQTALLRAAGLPGVWALLGFMAPLIPATVFTYQLIPAASVSGFVVMGISSLLSLASAVVWIIWCFKICVAREKSGWMGVLLLIPGVNLLMFTYLAFAE